MSFLDLNNAEDECYLWTSDYRKIMMVHDLRGLDLDAPLKARVNWKLYWHLFDLKFMTDRFYPSCIHREILFRGDKQHSSWFKRIKPLPDWKFVLTNHELMLSMQPLTSVKDYPAEYLPFKVDAAARKTDNQASLFIPKP